MPLFVGLKEISYVLIYGWDIPDSFLHLPRTLCVPFEIPDRVEAGM